MAKTKALEQAEPRTRHHLSISIDGVLAMTDEALENRYYVKEDGTPATPAETRATAQYYKVKGFEAIPTCDHHDEKGYCLGHPVLPETPQAKAKREIEDMLAETKDNLWQNWKGKGVRLRSGLVSLIVYREEPTDTGYKWFAFHADGAGVLGKGYSKDLETAKNDALCCALEYL